MNYFTQKRLFAIYAAMAIALTACSATPTRESTGEYFDDVTITTKVKAELLGAKDVSAAEINVETFKGRVQLSGFAKSAAEKRNAVTIAKSVRGVKEVIDDIRLK